MLERISEWYLRRRGRVVLSRLFMGIAIGNCTMKRIGEGHYRVFTAHPSPQIIALNCSLVDLSPTVTNSDPTGYKEKVAEISRRMREAQEE